MSQYPSPNDPYHAPTPVDPLPYAQGGYGYAPAKSRPTSVTVLAIIGIIWGSLVLLGSLCNGVAGSLTGDNPVVKAMQEDATLHGWTIVSTVLNIILGFLLLAGSIGSLSLKPWGRSSLIAYSWLDIVFTVVSLGVSFALVLPKLNQVLQNSRIDPAMKSTIQASSIGGQVFVVLLLALPVLILYYMSRPHVKAAFERGMLPPV